MTVSAYPDYRESDIAWVGLLPTSWRLHRVLDAVKLINGFPFDSQLFVPAGGFPLIRIRDLNQSQTDVCYAGQAVPAAEVTGRDLLIGMDGDFDVGRWKGTEVALLNQRVCCIRGADHIVRWMEYILPIPLKLINDLTYSTTVKHLSSGQVRSIRVPTPPTNAERDQILEFLDRETGKIDALVAEQERLIALLKEKRQAVISQAVTKGLNPDVPMKDSGVEWLGEVPAHWDVVALAMRYTVQLGRMLNDERSRGDDLRPYLRVLDVQWGKINIEDLPVMSFPSEVRALYRLRSGDLLVNEGGSYVGRSAIWRGEMDECYYQKALHRLRAKDTQTDTSEFLVFMMENATTLGVFVAGGGQTTIDHLTAEQLRRYRFAFPPIDEQLAIVDYVSRATTMISNLLAEAERAITLLRERRAALISAAVTGKIDVRDHTATSQAA